VPQAWASCNNSTPWQRNRTHDAAVYSQLSREAYGVEESDGKTDEATGLKGKGRHKQWQTTLCAARIVFWGMSLDRCCSGQAGTYASNAAIQCFRKIQGSSAPVIIAWIGIGRRDPMQAQEEPR